MTLLFWHLPFVSSKQALAVYERADPPVIEDEWTEKFNLFTAEHKLDGAREPLRTGWKEWLSPRIPGAAGKGSAADGVAAEGAALDHIWRTRQLELCCY